MGVTPSPYAAAKRNSPRTVRIGANGGIPPSPNAAAKGPGLGTVRGSGGHEATDTGLAYAPVSRAHGHHHIQFNVLPCCTPT